MESSLGTSRRQLARRQGDYGFDEPIWPVLFGLVGVALIIFSWLSFTSFGSLILGLLTLTLGIVSLFCSASYVYSARRGKLEVWADIRTDLQLRGDEQLLDLGC